MMARISFSDWKREVPPEIRLDHLAVASDIGVSREDLDRAYALLAPMGKYHLPTAVHCLRVGILAGRIAQRLGEEADIAFLGGTVHDDGKLDTPQRILDAGTITPEEHRQFIVPHVELGYRLTHHLLPEPAEALKYHHRFRRRNPYPEILPEPDEPYSPERAAVHKRLGRLIALADYTDAMRTRKNDKFGERPPSTQERQRYLREDHADIADELELLIADGIIGL